MDMQLVPVYADEGGDEGDRHDQPARAQNLGVRTAEATRARLVAPLTAVGSVAFNERDQAVVQARANGFVEKLFVRAPLDAVRAGQPLARAVRARVGRGAGGVPRRAPDEGRGHGGAGRRRARSACASPA